MNTFASSTITCSTGLHARTPAALAGARRSARGFSLLELMLVIAIIGILIAAAAVSLGGAAARAKIGVTRSSLASLKAALSQYNITTNGYPPALMTLVTIKPPYLEDKKLQDAWGHEWIYSPQAVSKEQPYILGSSGEDGITGNEDDINVWMMDK